MSKKVESILNNSDLVEHVVFYAGMKALIRHARHFVDPTSHQTPDLQLAYFECMCEGALEDLKIALAEHKVLDPKDAAFEPTLRQVIERLKAEIGMQQMITRARDILKELDGPDIHDQHPAGPFFPESECAGCEHCGRTRIPLLREDFPAALLSSRNMWGDPLVMAWYCPSCKQLQEDPSVPLQQSGAGF